MSGIPAVDPIPLPAPVWLFKLLHIVTLGLHFVAVEMLIGGLLIASVLNLLASLVKGHPRVGDRMAASAAIAKRLPIVMTYVINLGVPPLLFAQVLYGRALYTSSVLIGAYWIAIVPLIMLCYWLLYRFASGAERHRSVWWMGLLAWFVAGFIAHILSSNMTLMLRPEAWQAMYANSPGGVQLPGGDPTVFPRWLFMMSGGIWVAGLWMIWISKARVTDALRAYFTGLGSKLGMIFIAVQACVLFWVIAAQPAQVRGGVLHGIVPAASLGMWAVSILLAAAVAAGVAFGKLNLRVAGWGAALAVVLAELGWTTVRDCIRDLTLAGKGMDVWDRTVSTNWSVVGLFLILFVAGLGVIGWMASVMVRARPIVEGAAA